MSAAGPILPGSAIGVLGGGQLGRMFAIAARRMGYRVHTYSPDTDTPTGQVSDVEITAPYEDLDAVRRFARAVQVVTFEFENIPVATTEAAAESAPVRPAGAVLHTTQHRHREKQFLSEAGFPVAPFRMVRGPAEAAAAFESLGSPVVIKTAGFGYDGKGQRVAHSPEETARAFTLLGGEEAVLEAFIDFDCELSVLAARGLGGSFAHYDVIQNQHREHILDVSMAPAAVPPAVVARALEISRGVMDSLGVIGVLAVELFLTRSGELLVNELAPRPHNSGHLTFDACVTSQFEQQLRAVCGLPLGATDLLRPAAMANLLGDLWAEGEPAWAAALTDPDARLHLYGKIEPRAGRKMGHLTVLASTPEGARRRAIAARERLTSRSFSSVQRLE